MVTQASNKLTEQVNETLKEVLIVAVALDLTKSEQQTEKKESKSREAERERERERVRERIDLLHSKKIRYLHTCIYLASYTSTSQLDLEIQQHQ